MMSGVAGAAMAVAVPIPPQFVTRGCAMAGRGACNCTGACREVTPAPYVGKHRKPV